MKNTNPGHEYEQSTGAFPFTELSKINEGMYSAVIIGTPAGCINAGNVEHTENFAIEWIESLRFGAAWQVDWTQSGKYFIKETTKSSLPIVYVHRYSISNIDDFPNDFPDIIMDKKYNYSPTRVKKFVHKWYKSIGSNSVVLYPWEPDTLSEALNDALSYTRINRGGSSMETNGYG